MATRRRNVLIRVRFDDGVTAGATSAAGAMDLFASRTERVGQAVDAFAARAFGQQLQELAAGIVAPLGKAIQTEAKLQDTTALLAAITGESADKLDQFRHSVELTQAKLPVGTSEILNASQIIARLGFGLDKVRDQSGNLVPELLNLSTVAIKLAKSTDQSIDKVSSDLGSLINNFGVGAGKAFNMANAITALGFNMNASQKFIQEAGLRIGTVSQRLQIAPPFALALGGAMKGLGNQSRRAGTVVVNILEALGDPTNFRKIDRLLGQTSGTFDREFRRNSTEAIKALFPAIKELGLGLGELPAFLKDIGINNDLAKTGFEILVNQMDMVVDATKKGEDAFQGLTDVLGGVFEERLKTLNGQMSLFGGIMEAIESNVGRRLINDFLLPALTQINKLAFGILVFAQNNQEATKVIALLLGLTGGLLFLIGTVFSLIGIFKLASIAVIATASSMGVTLTSTNLLVNAFRVMSVVLGRVVIGSIARAGSAILFFALKLTSLQGILLATKIAAMTTWAAIAGPFGIGLLIAGIVVAIAAFGGFGSKVQTVLKLVANTLIFIINTVISLINLLPFVNIPTIGFFDTGASKAAKDEAAQDAKAATAAAGSVDPDKVVQGIDPRGGGPGGDIPGFGSAVPGGGPDPSFPGFGTGSTIPPLVVSAPAASPDIVVPNLTIPLTLTMDGTNVSNVVVQLSSDQIRNAMGDPDFATRGVA